MPTPTPTPRRGSLLLLLPIALILAVLAALFAWVGGWFGNSNLTPQKMMDFAETSGKQAAGFRRAHSKGVCFAGTFAPTPQAFQAMNEAGKPDPATGKPDPEKMKAVLAANPEIAAFQAWAKSAPRSDSLGSTRFNGVNAFRLTDARGVDRVVRWSMRPRLPFVAMTPEQLKSADANFLIEDLDRRLAAGPLVWDMVVQIAAPGDPITDPSKAWPDTRQEATLGTLTLAHAEPQANGPCRDVNFDPLILPTGIAASDDPVLHARSAAYSVSFNRREREISEGKNAYSSSQNGSAR